MLKTRFVIMALVLAPLTAMLGGCSTSSVQASPGDAGVNGAASKTTPLWIGGRGSSAVFRSPRASAELMEAPDESMPEYYRRDPELGSTPGPLLATNQWPQPDSPSTYRPRYVWLPRDASTYLYFERPSDDYGRYRGDGYRWSNR